MEFIFQCPHCAGDLTGESDSSGMDVACPLCGGSFRVPSAHNVEAEKSANAIEGMNQPQTSEAKLESPGVLSKVLAIVCAVARSARDTAQLFLLNIRLLFARGFSRSKALVRLGEKCYEERRLAEEEASLYLELDAQALHEANLRSAIDAEMGPSAGWCDKVKQIGSRWAKRADLARSGALRMKLHRDLGERFFRSEASAHPEDPAVATVIAEQQRIHALESKADDLRVHVPKILAHPAIAGVTLLSLLAVAGLAIPQGVTTALLPATFPFSTVSSGDKSVESPHDESPTPPASSNGLRRGPKIHGFQIGMTLDEFRSNLKGVYPGEVNEEMFQDGTHLMSLKSIGGDPLFDELLGPDVERFGVSYTPADGGFPLVIVDVAGEQETVISMKFDASILAKLFNLKGLRFREFCQQLINSYDIPQLEPVPDKVVPSMVNLGYESLEEGYSITCTPTFSLNLGIRPIDNRDRGFGR